MLGLGANSISSILDPNRHLVDVDGPVDPTRFPDVENDPERALDFVKGLLMPLSDIKQQDVTLAFLRGDGTNLKGEPLDRTAVAKVAEYLILGKALERTIEEGRFIVSSYTKLKPDEIARMKIQLAHMVLVPYLDASSAHNSHDQSDILDFHSLFRVITDSAKVIHSAHMPGNITDRNRAYMEYHADTDKILLSQALVVAGRLVTSDGESNSLQSFIDSLESSTPSTN